MTQMQFLDITVFKGSRFENEKILDVKLYRKPTDNFQYLEKSSAHPSSVFKGLILGEVTRFVRSSNNKIDLETQTEFFKQKLIDRGYSETDIVPLVEKAKQKSRSNALCYKRKNKKTAPPLVFATRYNPVFKNLGRCIRKHWHLIEKDTSTKNLFPRPPIIAYRRHKNLKEYLTSAKL